MTTYTNEVFQLGTDEEIKYHAQLAAGAMAVSADETVFLHQTDASASGVTKSTVNVSTTPITNETSTISVEFDIYIPAGSSTDQIYILDLENTSTQLSDKAPGLRVYLQDGLLTVNRAKIGFTDEWTAVHNPITTEKWYTVRVDMVPGGEATGRIEISLDGQPVLEETGTNVLTQQTMSQYGLTLDTGEIDRIQVGLTANDSGVESSLATRNISIQIDDVDKGGLSTVTVDPATLAGDAERPIEVLSATETFDDAVVETNPDGGFTLLGTDANNSLRGELGADLIEGGQGDDTIIGGEGNDTLRGQADDDVLSGGLGDDWVHGGFGNDIIFDGAGSDTSLGAEGNDAFVYFDDAVSGPGGTTDANTIDGGAGDDRLLIILSQERADQLSSLPISSEEDLFAALNLTVTDVEEVEIAIGLDAVIASTEDTDFGTLADLWL